jgi:hypothetical protein
VAIRILKNVNIPRTTKRIIPPWRRLLRLIIEHGVEEKVAGPLRRRPAQSVSD